MNKQTHHIVASFITGVLIFPLLAIVLMQCRQLYVQHTIKERMEKLALHTLQIEASDFSWVKEGKEINVDGKMFDVHSYTVHKNKVIVLGIFDEEETAINKFLSGQNTNNSWLIQLLYFGGLICAIPLFIFYSLDSLGNCKKQFSKTIRIYTNRAIEIITPPPQFVFA